MCILRQNCNLELLKYAKSRILPSSFIILFVCCQFLAQYTHLWRGKLSLVKARHSIELSIYCTTTTTIFRLILLTISLSLCFFCFIIISCISCLCTNEYIHTEQDRCRYSWQLIIHNGLGNLIMLM